MERTTRVDFHCHSDVSDGYFSPEALAHKLADAGVRYAALTDHDSIAGLSRFARVASLRGMVSIPGVELTVALAGGGQAHLLAYGFDAASPAMKAVLDRTAPAAAVISLIHQAGGKAFLAHPLHGGMGADTPDGPFRQLVAAGLDGLEAYYKPYPREAQEALGLLARKHGLLTIGGSDFHGHDQAGAPEPGVDMPADSWQRLRKVLGRNHGHGAGRETRKVEPAAPGLDWRWFVLRIVLPVTLVIGSFIALLFAMVIPTMEQSLLARKLDMTVELTNSAWSILADHERDEREGRRTRAEAQADATERIRHLRYGPEGKDYFWITDMHPRMIMHPYRQDLDGQDLSHFTDPDGVRLFVEFANMARERDHGHVNYVWQWKDDPGRMAAKQSYVRGFGPWGWVIGTGIYVEDVRAEVKAITGRVINVSLTITLLAGMLLLTVTQQSLRVERRRSDMERELRLSHEKYRALVESATEGTLLLMDERCSYANRTLLSMLGYTAEELAFLDIQDLLADDDTAGTVVATLDSVLKGAEAPATFEATLRTHAGDAVNVLMTATPIAIAGSEGLIVTVRDMAGHKAIVDELGASRAKYLTLAENVQAGVFRAAVSGRGPLVELNPAGRRILGLSTEAELDVGLRDVLADAVVADRLFSRLHAEDSIRDMILQVCKTDGTFATVSVSAVLVRDDDGQALYCDGLMEEVSERRRSEAERESLISQLQASLLFLNEPVRNSMLPPLSCSLDTTIEQSAALMARNDSSALVVTGETGQTIGIVTDHDLRERVVATGLGSDLPVYHIMSSPVVSITEGAPVYEAFLLMRERKVRHLVVRDHGDHTIGIVRNKEIVRLDRYSPVVLTREIQSASTLDDLAACNARLPALVGSLVDSGALPHNICRVVTAVSDVVSQRILSMALDDLGPPPVPFAFVALGSEGREEQTLATDQDNAIIYEDPQGDLDRDVSAYFHALGERVCEWLDRAGYAYCPGDMMARNPQWNQPLSRWKEAFARWIMEPEEKELLKFNIFFDFRCIHGDPSLTRDLRDHVQQVLGRQPAFFLHMADHSLHYRPPIGLFGQIVTGGAGASPNTFSVKEAMLPIVNFARLYALQNGIEDTNTLDRLNELHVRGVLRQDNHAAIHQAYGYLMQLRYKHQVDLLREGRPPDNEIDPKALTQIELSMLKQTFSQISMIQKKVSFDFKGAA